MLREGKGYYIKRRRGINVKRGKGILYKEEERDKMLRGGIK